MVTPADFCPINQWKIESDCLIDQTTGRAYWNLSRRVVWVKCLKLAIAVPICVFREIVIHLFEIATFYSFRRWDAGPVTWIKVQNWIKEGIAETLKNILCVTLGPLRCTVLVLSALYGLVNPYDGRKLFRSFDRLCGSGYSVVFKPNDGVSLCQQFIKDLMTIFIKDLMTISVCEFLRLVFHEMGHWVAMKALFTDVNPWITLTLLEGGYCSWGGPAVKPSRLGNHFTRRTAVGLTSLAGPLVDTLGSIVASALAGHLNKDRKTQKIAKVLAWFGFMAAGSNISYSINDFTAPMNPGEPAGHDFRTVSNLFEIPRSYLATAVIALSVMPIYRSWNIFFDNLKAKAVEEPL